jgi:NADH:ubiquinone oxidoreductase subunit E
MLTIVICVGSSCHVRGSDDIAATFERLIQEDGLSSQVELIGAFCMDACSMGVSIRVGDRVYRQVRPADAESFFASEVLPLVTASAVG